MKITPEILERYYSGTCTDEERQMVEAWLAENDMPTDPRLPEHVDWDSEDKAIWGRLQYSIRPKQRPNIKLLYKIAACLVCGLLVWGGVRYTMQYMGTDNVQTVYQEAHTGQGERKEILLADGTRVLLNGGSTLCYPMAFDGEERRVSLVGHAMFEVAKDPGKPFFVQTTETETRVLGTVFSLKAFAGEETFLSVEEGKVLFRALRDTAQQHIFLATQWGKISREGTLYFHDNGSEEHHAWASANLVFDQVALKNVMTELEEKYHVEIHFKDRQLSEERFSGEFLPTQSLDFVLDRLAFVMGIKYNKNEKNNTIWISK